MAPPDDAVQSLQSNFIPHKTNRSMQIKLPQLKDKKNPNHGLSLSIFVQRVNPWDTEAKEFVRACRQKTLTDLDLCDFHGTAVPSTAFCCRAGVFSDGIRPRSWVAL